MNDDDQDPSQDPEDLAPDADEDGDSDLPEELKGLTHKGKPKKDNVDQLELSDRRIGT